MEALATTWLRGEWIREPSEREKKISQEGRGKEGMKEAFERSSPSGEKHRNFDVASASL